MVVPLLSYMHCGPVSVHVHPAVQELTKRRVEVYHDGGTGIPTRSETRSDPAGAGA